LSQATIRWARLGLLALLVAACGSPAPSPRSSGETAGPQASGDASNPPERGRSPAAVEPPPGPSAGPVTPEIGLRLAEIGLGPGAAAFVEIVNIGPDAEALLSLSLRIGDRGFLLGGATEPLAPGSRLLVRFDEGNSVEPGLIHAEAGYTLDSLDGSVELLDGFGRTIDRVAWGSAPDAVRPGPGGFVPDGLEPDAVIARAPGADRPVDPRTWVRSYLVPRLGGVRSGGRRNNRRQHSGGSSVLEGLAGSRVQPRGDDVQVGLAVDRQVGLLGEVLAEEAVGGRR
jgi:hypothetical protein